MKLNSKRTTQFAPQTMRNIYLMFCGAESERNSGLGVALVAGSRATLSRYIKIGLQFQPPPYTIREIEEQVLTWKG